MVKFISLCIPGWAGTPDLYLRLAFSSRQSSCLSLSTTAAITQADFSRTGGKAGLNTTVDLGLKASIVKIAEHKTSDGVTRY